MTGLEGQSFVVSVVSEPFQLSQVWNVIRGAKSSKGRTVVQNDLSFLMGSRDAWGTTSEPRWNIDIITRYKFDVSGICPNPLKISAILNTYGCSKLLQKMRIFDRELTANGNGVMPVRTLSRNSKTSWLPN
ncbi:uncharacterized protein LOC131997272 [Stomoxys calcitrans]|uniref:uncharacterized protein LOC131997272 n=1 Tax=Stomoxys calcitrans TaxID=35570 RepID=UPI0027E36E01|nr:uncharacterized protein LOC131997272 [Stomoxys calcitrans]